MWKFFAGIALIIGGIALGLYVGVWLMFVGGIFDIIQFFKEGAEVFNKLGWGIIKVACASVAGWLSFFVLFVPGVNMIYDSGGTI